MTDILHIQQLWMALLFGLVLLVLSRQWNILNPGPPTTLQRIFSLSAWVSIFIGFIGWWASVSGPLAIVWIPAMLIVVFGFARYRYQRIENQSLASLLLSTIQQGGSPLECAIAYRSESHGVQQDKVDRLARSLGSGMDILTAAAYSKVYLPEENKLALEIAKEFPGHQIFERTADELLEKEFDESKRLDTVIAALMSIILLSTIAVLIQVFLSFQIIPQLEMIAQEFSISNPFMTRFFEFNGQLVVAVVPIFAIVILISAGLLLLLTLMELGIVSELPWGFRWLHGPMNECRLLNTLALAADANVPIQSAIAILKQKFVSNRMRRILRHANTQLSQGGDWIGVLTQARVLNASEASLAGAGQNAGNLAWSLSQISQGKSRRHHQWMQPIRQFALPILVFLLAFPVFMNALGVFIPIIEFVRHQS